MVIMRFDYNTRLKKYLISGNGKIYLKNRIGNFLKEYNGAHPVEKKSYGVNTHVSEKSLANIKARWIIFSNLLNGITMNYKKNPKEEIKTAYTYNYVTYNSPSE